MEGKTLDGLDEVGCVKCGTGGNWEIYTDGKGKFKAKHSCGHVSDFTIKKSPDMIAIPMKLLV